MSCWMMLNVTRVGKIKSSSFAGSTWDMTNSVHSCSWKLQVQDTNWLYYCVIIINYITVDDQNTIRQYQWIDIVCWVVSARDFLQKFQSCRFIRIEVQTIFWNMKLLSVVVIIVVGETRKKIEKKPRHQDFVTSNMSKVGKWIFFFYYFLSSTRDMSSIGWMFDTWERFKMFDEQIMNLWGFQIFDCYWSCWRCSTWCQRTFEYETFNSTSMNFDIRTFISFDFLLSRHRKLRETENESV